MEDFVDRWLFDPTIGKIITVVVGILLIIVLVRFAQRTQSRYVKDGDIRYHTRKFVSFIGYATVIFFLATVFSDKLGGLTVWPSPAPVSPPLCKK